MVALAVPLASANLLQMAVFAIDVVFIARLGTRPLAAATLSTAVFGLGIWSLSGFVGGAAPLIAAALGRGRHAVRDVRRTVRMGMWLAIASGALLMALSAAGEALMLAAGQPADIAGLADDYLAILKWTAIPMIVASVLRIFVSSLGRAAIATWVTVLAVAVNAFGNWVLIFGNLGAPALGLEGAAIASVVTSLAMLAAYIAIIQTDRRFRRYALFGRLWRPDPARIRDIAAIGAPIAGIVVVEAGLFSIAAFLMGRFGAAELAAHTVALQIASIAFQVPFGIGQAATIRVGLHHGAGHVQGVTRAGQAALAIAAAFALPFALVMLLIPRTLLSAYLDVDAAANAAIVMLATRYMMIAAAFQLADGVQAVLAGNLRGLQDTRVPLLLALIGYWLTGFTTAWGLGFMTPLKGVGVWIGLAVGLAVTALLLQHRWRHRGYLLIAAASSEKLSHRLDRNA